MTKIWHSVSKDVLDFARANGFEVKSEGQFPFEHHQVLATDEELEHMYDYLTAACEHISCPTI